jgi:hypothetical protein
MGWCVDRQAYGMMEYLLSTKVLVGSSCVYLHKWIGCAEMTSDAVMERESHSDEYPLVLRNE